ncbi:hypothetical protein, partial [Aeromonas caviae]|uniref:hypothetical protein n=1 Tax=Aeromonas caviae TaxID=648 RepID=UPI002B47147B
QHGSPGGSAGRPCPRLAGQAPQAGVSRFAGNGSATKATTNMAHLAGLLVGLAQGWLDRHHRPA